MTKLSMEANLLTGGEAPRLYPLPAGREPRTALYKLVVGVDLRCLLDSRGSGVATYAKLMLQSLRNENDKNFRLIAFTSGFSPAPDLSSLLPVDGRHRHFCFPNRILNLAMSIAKWPSVKRCFGEATIVWQPNPLFIPSIKVPLFVTVHDISFIRFPQFFLPHTRAWYLRWVRHWLKMAPPNAHLIVDSEYVKNDILSLFPQWQNRLAVFMPPIPTGQIQTSIDLKNSYGLDRPFILGLGTIEPRKNIASLVVAYKYFARRYPEFDLVLIGHYRHQDRRALLRLAGNFHSRLKFLGYVPYPHREEILSKAFCLVYPSYYEGFGYPPLEAMSHGVPVVASAVSSLPEILGSAAMFIDPYRGAEEIAVALDILAHDREVYKKLQVAGLSRVNELRERFTLQPLLSLWRNFVSA